MDITLQMIGTDAPVPASPDKGRAGDIIAVYPLVNEAPSPNSRLVFVHVQGCPAASIIDLEPLTRDIWDMESLDEKGEPTIKLAKHPWFFDPTDADPAGIAQLTAERQITIDWARAKQLVRNRVTGALLTDGDVGQ